MWRFLLAGLALSLPAHATPIALSPASVISSSVSYPTYPAGNVLDQQSGPTTETFGSRYWLAPDNTRGPVFLVIDLGASMPLGSVGIYNTHNGSFQDRGTGAFTLLGGNTRPAAGAQLTGASTLVNGTLEAESATATALTEQMFSITDPATYRYVEFLPLTTATVNAAASPTAFGLNELLLFGVQTVAAIPEPGTAPLLGASLMLLLGACRARTATARRRRAPAVDRSGPRCR